MLKINTKFKNTEVGPIPEEWGIKYFSDVFEITSSKRIFMSEYVSSGVPFFRGKEIIEKAKGNKKVSTSLYITEERFNKIASIFGAPCENDILMSSVGTIGVPYLVSRGEKFYFKDGNLTWFKNFSKNICQKFIYYWLISPVGTQNILASAIGSTQQALTIDGLRKNFIPLPPISEQKQIAEILSSLDDKIELNRKINENLEKIASTLFKHWFVDFEFPDKNGKPYKSNGGKMIDSELGPIPEGWRVGKVSNLIKVESGFSFNSSMFDVSGQYKLVTIKNVQDGYFVSGCADSLSTIPTKMPTHCLLKSGDILLSLTGNVGRICLINGENYLLNQRVANLIPINESNRAFTYWLFRQKDFQNILINISRGTAQQNLSPIETNSLKIIIPSDEALNNFANIGNILFKKIIENYNEINSLSALRDSLIPKLMSGKIRV